MNKLKLIFSLLLIVCFNITNAQNGNKIKVTGKVISAETSKPLGNASVTIKGTKKGTITDSLGNFSLKVDKGQTIVVSFASFESQETKITSAVHLDVKLAVKFFDNEEVVVVGYGTRKKSHLTGAISKLTTDEAIGQIPVSRLDDALKGKLSGVNVLTTDAQAGAAPTIQIRGATSITASSEPLIVIDGYPVPTDLSAIDMNDVESIEILKDAASAAIYGSRGGNGVIMITTKSGKVGKAKFSVNVSSGLKNVYRKISFPTLPAWKEYVKSINNGLSTPEIDQAEIFNANTDAQDFIFRQVQFSNVSVGASGGTTNFKYNISANALFDNGIMLGNDFKRFGLRAAFTVKAGSKTTIDFSVNPSVTQRFDVPVTVQEAIRTLPPWMPVYHTAATAAATGMPIGSIANQREFSPV
ncbi:MAG: TonB-dependent receptor plug domain-containing protein, partial [Chitinophagaceae bacterium]